MVCAIAVVDSESKKRLVELANITERFGIAPRNVYGHVTLATYIGHHESEFVESCKAKLSVQKRFSIYYDNIEIWKPQTFIVAAPRKDDVITAIQKDISEDWAEDLNNWTQANVWQPHTTLVTDPRADFHAIAEAMQEKFKPFVARVDRIEFSQVYDDGYEVFDCVELQ